MSDHVAPLAPGFELTEHTADVGVRAWGRSREDVYAQAARGLLSLVCDAAAVEGRERYEIALDAADGELLLAAWLNELLYLVEGRRVVLSGEFEIDLTEPPGPAGLRALVAGEPYDPARHVLRGAVKAATLHRLSLRAVGGGWEGHVLLDV